MIDAAALLELEPLGDDIFRAHTSLDNLMGIAFGGQPMLQGLAAARRTVPDWPAHSLSSTFLRGGAIDRPIDYRVERMRDGGRFAARRVVASQDGVPIHDMLCSFHDPAAEGAGHVAIVAPPIPAPETLPSLTAFVAANRDALPPLLAQLYATPFPIELRLIDPHAVLLARDPSPVRAYWFRTPSAAALTDPADHQAVLALMSDYWFAGAAGAPHLTAANAASTRVLTLNHALWFHAPQRTDDWLLYRTESPWAGSGRGLVRGTIHDRAGRLIASAVQEISLRC